MNLKLDSCLFLVTCIFEFISINNLWPDTTMILTIITFVIVLSILIIAHEFGHFMVAKKTGIKVEEFALGFPPRVWTKRIGETNYSINAIPLGGYVKMLGEVEKSTDPRAFENQSRGVRFSVAVAGVLMNLVLAWVLLTVGFAIGMSPVISDYHTIPGKVIKNEIVIADVLKNSAAEKAGFQPMDVVYSAVFNGQETTFSTVEGLSDFTKAHQGDEITFNYQRNKQNSQQKVILDKNTDSPLGVASVNNAVIRVPWYKAPYVALRETYEITKYTGIFVGSFFGKLFSTGKVSDQVGGPVQIYMATGTVIKIGFMAVMQFIAILSINLAIINILPLPALDGGRILFIIIETIARRRLIKENIEAIIHTVGFALLFLLIILVTYNDIVKLIAK